MKAVLFFVYKIRYEIHFLMILIHQNFTLKLTEFRHEGAGPVFAQCQNESGRCGNSAKVSLVKFNHF
jgi:hypothetical protein